MPKNDDWWETPSASAPADSMQTADDGWWDKPSKQADKTLVKEHMRTKRRPQGTMKAVGEGIPAVLGSVGQGLAGPVGAAVGGGAGQILQQALYAGGGYDVPPPFSAESAMQIGGEAATQAAYGKFGDAVGPALQGMARGTMRLAAKVTPEVAQTAVKEGIAFSRAGLQRAMNLMGKLGREKRIAMAQVGRGGLRFERQEIADEAFQRVLNELSDMPEHALLKPRLIRYRNMMLVGNNAARMAPHQLDDMRRMAAGVAKPVYDAAGRLVPPATAGHSLRVKWHAAVADAAEKRLNAIPEVALINERLAKVIDLKNTVAAVTQYGKLQGVKEQLIGRGAGAAAGAIAGATIAPPGSTVKTRAAMGAAGALGGAAAASPQAMSALALALGNPEFAKLLGRLPRAAGWAGSSSMP